MAATLTSPSAPRPHLTLVPTGDALRETGDRGTTVRSPSRGRALLVIVSIPVFVVLAVLTVIAGRGGLADLAGSELDRVDVAASAEVVEVRPGDTVWSIARRIQPSGDVRPLVDGIVALNGGADLQIGALLRLPA